MSIEDFKQNNQNVSFKSKYSSIYLWVGLIGLILSFVNVGEGPYMDLINEELTKKGYEVGLFPPLFFLISLWVIRSTQNTGWNILIFGFFTITVLSELFYNYGGILFMDSWSYNFFFYTFLFSVLIMNILNVLVFIERRKWFNSL